MYYRESERLATEHPDLARVLEKVDDKLAGLPSDSILRPEVLATALEERESQVKNAFRLLAESGLLRAEESIECPTCQNVAELASYLEAQENGDECLCSQCGIDLARSNPLRVQVFRREGGRRRNRGEDFANGGEACEVFYSYAHEDEQLREELEKHLSLLRREGRIREWHDRRIAPGNEWRGKIDSHLNSADVILLLVSADFLSSDYCYSKEMNRAIERHKTGEARVIPIILRAVDNWESAPFGSLQGLPKDGKPVTSWTNMDEAFTDIARGIRNAIDELRGNPGGCQREG